MSQFGVIEDLVRGCFPEGFMGVAVDIGASNGVMSSNTLELEREGWTVLCVEPNWRYQESLRKHRKLVKQYAVGAGNIDDAEMTSYHIGNNNWDSCSALVPDPFMVAQHMPLILETEKKVVKLRTLDTILAEVGLTRIDFLSVDVEGYEEKVFEGFDLARWLPKIIIVEQWGHKHQSLRPQIESAGYRHHTRIEDNDDVYVREA